jgi:hypothetical protein
VCHNIRFRGAMVARLTPDQKVACSSHVGIRFLGETVNLKTLILKLKIVLGVGIEPTSHKLRPDFFFFFPDLKSGALTTRPT